MAEAKKRVVVLYGGRSTEHSISCVSAGAVLSAIDRDLFDPVPVGITKTGEWIVSDADPRQWTLNDLPVLKADAKSRPVTLDLTRHGDGFLVGEPGTVGRDPADQHLTPMGHVDAVFPVLHGIGGEDGAIQGFLETAGIPYVGCGIFASAACMDKHFTKVLLKAAGIPVAPGTVLDMRRYDAASGYEKSRQAIEDEIAKAGLTYPLFVKPGNGGSSIGISPVETEEDLLPALRTAAEDDSEVIVEKKITAREVECAVLSLDNSKAPQTAWPGEVVKEQPNSFYDFTQKYEAASTSHAQIPADLPKETLEKVREIAARAFTAVGGRGLSRVDTFVQPDGTIMVNEINTMPGFTAISMWPKAWEHMGLPYSKAITELIDSVL